MICVHDLSRGEVSVKVGIMEFGLHYSCHVVNVVVAAANITGVPTTFLYNGANCNNRS